MNKEVEKAMNKKPSKKTTFKNWWRRNNYKVWRVILFPVWWGYKLYRYVNEKIKNETPWDETHANEIFNYYVPRFAKWDNSTKTFYFFDNGLGWDMKQTKKLIKPKDRKFWELHARWGGKMRDYLINNFELEGFTKQVGCCCEGWTELSFILRDS